MNYIITRSYGSTDIEYFGGFYGHGTSGRLPGWVPNIKDAHEFTIRDDAERRLAWIEKNGSGRWKYEIVEIVGTHSPSDDYDRAMGII